MENGQTEKDYRMTREVHILGQAIVKYDTPQHILDEINKIYAAVGFDPNTRTYIPDYEEQPIEWVRIHNLPDLAYFNHSQHVNVGNIECQTCHGTVEEMDVMYQYEELTMGWCVKCHKTTEVAMEGNDYYTKMHQKMKENSQIVKSMQYMNIRFVPRPCKS